MTPTCVRLSSSECLCRSSCNPRSRRIVALLEVDVLEKIAPGHAGRNAVALYVDPLQVRDHALTGMSRSRRYSPMAVSTNPVVIRGSPGNAEWASGSHRPLDGGGIAIE